MRRTLRMVFLSLLAVLAMISSQGAWAQATTGSIYGRVTDSTQAALPGTQITAIGERTGVRYPGVSDAEGNYSVLACRRDHTLSRSRKTAAEQ